MEMPKVGEVWITFIYNGEAILFDILEVRLTQVELESRRNPKLRSRINTSYVLARFKRATKLDTYLYE